MKRAGDGREAQRAHSGSLSSQKKKEKKKSKSGFRRRARATGGKVAVISFRFKDVDIIDVGLIVED
jgi:ribosomal protein L34